MSDDDDNVVYGIDFKEPHKKETLKNKHFALDNKGQLHFIGDSTWEEPDWNVMTAWTKYNAPEEGTSVLLVNGEVVARWLHCFLQNVVDPANLEFEFEDDEEE